MNEQETLAQTTARAVLEQQRKTESAKNTGAIIGFVCGVVIAWYGWQAGWGYASLAIGFVAACFIATPIYAKLRP